jgi:hypothetical protein
VPASSASGSSVLPVAFSAIWQIWRSNVAHKGRTKNPRATIEILWKLWEIMVKDAKHLIIWYMTYGV